ncbi:MAG: hypothetical protein H6920_11470 [Sphingomonadaceae bacterium]|nr:hypothetical protein [Rhodobiaceae bacterium]MCP5384574.1 hypothetical protein [Altererythrobacter sp.]MCP5392226.1 hypothetical protein [Sphingomonadaceae bacterium]
MVNLSDEEARATSLLAGRVLERVRRYRPNEVLIEFSDGTRLFVDASIQLELSIHGGRIEEE